MTPVSRAETGRGDPEEWQVGARVARFARRRTADRVGEMVVESDMTGSKDHLRLRLVELIEAEKVGDPLVVHGAAMELAASAAQYAISLQLTEPIFAAELREAMKSTNGKRRAAS